MAGAGPFWREMAGAPNRGIGLDPQCSPRRHHFWCNESVRERQKIKLGWWLGLGAPEHWLVNGREVNYRHSTAMDQGGGAVAAA